MATYDKTATSTDTVDTRKLYNEVVADSAIGDKVDLAIFEGRDADGNVDDTKFTVVANPDFDEDESTALDAVVAAHNGNRDTVRRTFSVRDESVQSVPSEGDETDVLVLDLTGVELDGGLWTFTASMELRIDSGIEAVARIVATPGGEVGIARVTADDWDSRVMFHVRNIPDRLSPSIALKLDAGASIRRARVSLTPAVEEE